MRGTPWPTTREEHHDRALVVCALVSLGQKQLCFTVSDVLRELTGNLHMTLHCPRQLGRHVAALEPVTVISVAQPLGAFMPEPDAGGPPVSARKTHHMYALSERERELERSAPPLTDAARVYIALWIATRVRNTDSVSTHAVTEVCRAIPELTVDVRQQMAMRLKNLARRGVPLVAMDVAPAADGTAQRWTRWRPIGRGPGELPFQHAVPAFEMWVETVRALMGTAADLGAYATTHELVADIVTLAIASTKSPHWPAGHSVSMEHIRSARAESPEVRALCARLECSGTTMGKVLGDATKVRIAGRERVSRRVIKVGSVDGEQTYYDVAGLTGLEQRAAYVAVQGLRADAALERVKELQRDCLEAQALTQWVACPAAAEALAAISAVRVLLAVREMAALENRVQALLEDRHSLSALTQKTILALAARTRAALLGSGKDLAVVEGAARTAVAACGVDLDSILAAQPPILIGEDYRQWIPQQKQGTRSGPELMGDATTVRRHPNPAYRNHRSSDPHEAARTGLDRVDALLHLAERQSASTLAFLQSGARLLGTTLRDGALFVRLLDANDSKHWGGALAALALLGRPAAESTAREVISRGHFSDRLAFSLYTLAVMRRGDGPWPSALAQDPTPAVSRALRAVLQAKRTGAWLL